MNQAPQCEDEFGLAFETAFAYLRETVNEVCAQGIEWPEKVAAAVQAAVEFAATEPTAARMLTLETLVQRPAGGKLYIQLIEHFADQLRQSAPNDPRRPPSTEQALIAALAGMIADHLRYGAVGQLCDVESELVEFVLMPYLGRAEAKQWALRAGDRPGGPSA